MAWETANTEKTVYAHSEGRTEEFHFSQDTQLSEVVEEVASEMGMSTVIVKSDGVEIQPEAGNRPISELGKVEIYPKFAGAI